MRKMENNNLKLNAIAWKAESAGQSYGKFSCFLSDEDKTQIYMEYEQMLERRKAEEDTRLEQFCTSQVEKKNNRTKRNKVSFFRHI